MGLTFHNQLALNKAFQCVEEALIIRKACLSRDAQEIGDTLNMIGFLQVQRGEFEKALTLLWDALHIRKKHKDHMKVSDTLKNIGNVHSEKKDHKLAVECYEKCVSIR
mmetsp:Transcript_33560/g.37111  ORF Transcript_33560/g.37111 Transcript_33560/m.37111 type:complete len:108 (+) Transcript_33560:400-723(+)